ncbi:IS3 family transposase [Streptomyces albireticuli]|uniref:IS3 family transposase n=1 Tax=Streptomyces albireticuli TaxID=1940 RepID=A0A2A2D611_9ACTN|nr:IS3 family transposase [Streptomyces albireticuli]MCD9146180.1 IS3 family transposase [Streptomyces albireticuli]MCD9166294.1 IS3 family transposase [Streptomyces albireticuli]MCD9196619.1 IS3 family transposase [Streptomyces albireticuli]PAU47893.1 IS3 family transposase [Streptomyces albireticuli]
MGMKHYPAEFKADAVALYRSRPGATIKSVAADLGVNTETLRNWIRAADGRRPGAHSAPPAVVRTGGDDVQAELAEARKRIRELEEERDILRKAARYFGDGDALVNRCQFVDDHQRRHGVKRLCDILGLSRSSFYYWRRTAAARAARQTAEAGIEARIREVHQNSDGTYGAPRVTAELRDEGIRINHKRVARIMRTIGLEGVRLRRRHQTTVADPATAKAPDLICRDFSADAVNTKYVGDITYLPVSGAKSLYLATVIDLASRRLAGWAIADHMRAELVVDALAAAERTRGSLAGSVMHTDHGSQYTSRAFAEICRSAGVRQSMGAIGSSADNAAAESFNAAFKRETLKGRKAWSSEREARLDAFRWLTRYNTRRRHSRLGQRSPIAYENDFQPAATTLTQAA